MKHTAKTCLRSNVVDVHLAGAGGTGSLLFGHLLNLHAALIARGHYGINVTVFDPDTVSAANIGRQKFYASDLGRNKAEVLIERAAATFGVKWQAQPRRYESSGYSCDLLLSCVDSRKSRREIIRDADASYHLDCGNGNDFGQVAVGDGSRTLPWPQQLMPELFDASLDGEDADLPSCSLADALLKQELPVNAFAANIAIQLLWSLFAHGGLDVQGAFFNLRTLEMRPIAIKTNKRKEK